MRAVPFPGRPVTGIGLKPADPWTTVGAMAALAIIAATGAAVPARRATRINPLTALREE